MADDITASNKQNVIVIILGMNWPEIFLQVISRLWKASREKPANYCLKEKQKVNVTGPNVGY